MSKVGVSNGTRTVCFLGTAALAGLVALSALAQAQQKPDLHAGGPDPSLIP